jgi:hypothetical protein
MNSDLHFHFITEGPMNTELLHTALPHHKPLLCNASFVRELEYTSMKGKSVGVLGRDWTIRMPLADIDFLAPRAIDPSMQEAIRASLMQEKDENVPIPWVRAPALFTSLLPFSHCIDRLYYY